MSGEKIRVENPNTPGRVENVDAAKYTAMKAAMRHKTKPLTFTKV